MEAAEPEEPEPQVIIDSATEPQQEVSKAESPESLARLEEFQLLRQQFSEAEPAPPEADRPVAAPPPNAGPTEPEAPDEEEWHRAFERLAASTDLPDQDQEQPSEVYRAVEGTDFHPQRQTEQPVSPPSAPATESPESAARTDEFQRLRQEVSDTDSGADASPIQAGESTDRATPTPKPQQVTPPPDTEESEEGIRRSQEFELLRAQAAEAETAEAPASRGPQAATTPQTTTPSQTEPKDISEQSESWPEEAKRDVGPDEEAPLEVADGESVGGRGIPSGGQVAAAVGHAFASLARGGKHALGRLVPQTQREVTSITSENGAVKVLVTRGRSVIDYRIVEANPRHFREGAMRLASLDSCRMPFRPCKADTVALSEPSRAIKRTCGVSTCPT